MQRRAISPQMLTQSCVTTSLWGSHVVRMIQPFHPSPSSFKRSQMADYLSAMAPVSTNASWLGESGYALARYRAFLKHATKPSSHDQQSPQHGVWPTCGPSCAAYIAHNFPGTLGLFCRTHRLP